MAVRTELINTTRGLVKSMGTRLPSVRSELREQGRGSDSGTDTESIAATGVFSRGLSACIAGYDQRIEELASKKYGHTKMLRQVKGVGPIMALVYLLTLENPERIWD